MAVLVFRGGRWRWGRGGWGGFIPHAGPGQGLWPVGGVEVDAGLVWLVAAGERCVSSRATTSTGTPRRISPDDYPYRARWRVSSLLHAADRAGADQESDRRNAAVSVPVAWRPSPVRAAAPCTCSWTTRPWPDAGQRWRTPGSGSPTSASPAPARMAGAWRAAARALPHVPLVATEHNQMSWPAGDHTPRARDAARRVDLVFAHGPPARAWAARIGLDDGRLRDGRSSVEDLSAAALPGLPSPRLTLAGRLRGDKAPDVLIEALALIDAPPPAYLAGDGPLRGALTRLIRVGGLEAVVHLPGWSHEPARYIAQATVHVVPHARSRGRKAPCWPSGSASRSSAPRSTAWRAPWAGAAASWSRGDPRALAGALSRVLAGERPIPPSAGPAPGSSPPAQRPRYTPAPSGAGPGRVGCSPDRDGRAYGPPGHSAPACVQRERPVRSRKPRF